jgi:hypothetical protein
MTAGTGVFHSEVNPSATETHLLQIWILPEKTGLTPGYEQKLFERKDKLNRWCLLGSRDGRDGALTIHQDIDMSSTILEVGQSLDYAFAEGRRGFLQVVKGQVQMGDEKLLQGDGVAIVDTSSITIDATEEAELLMFDMA